MQPTMSTQEMHDYIAKVAGQPPLGTVQEMVKQSMLQGVPLSGSSLAAVRWHLTRLGHLLEDGE